MYLETFDGGHGMFREKEEMSLLNILGIRMYLFIYLLNFNVSISPKANISRLIISPGYIYLYWIQYY